jgi:hypothetical protein
METENKLSHLCKLSGQKREAVLIFSLSKAYCLCSIITSIFHARNSMASSRTISSSQQRYSVWRNTHGHSKSQNFHKNVTRYQVTKDSSKVIFACYSEFILTLFLFLEKYPHISSCLFRKPPLHDSLHN